MSSNQKIEIIIIVLLIFCSLIFTISIPYYVKSTLVGNPFDIGGNPSSILIGFDVILRACALYIIDITIKTLLVGILLIKLKTINNQTQK